MEDLFESDDRLKIIKVLRPSQKIYSKKAFNLAIQHVLFTRKTTMLKKRTLDRFRKIFSFVESELT